MTRKNPGTDQEQVPAQCAADRGLRHLVVAGAARLERAEAHGGVAAWHYVDREWSRRSGWRTRQHAQEGGQMSNMNAESGLPVEVVSASEVDEDGPTHDDSQTLLDALSRRARRLGRHLRRTKAVPERILKLMD